MHAIVCHSARRTVNETFAQARRQESRTDMSTKTGFQLFTNDERGAERFVLTKYSAYGDLPLNNLRKPEAACTKRFTRG